MKRSYYFSHDAYNRHDPSVAAMRAAYGPSGYGMYWMLLELMREQENYKVRISGKHDYTVISKQLDVGREEVIKFIEDCVEEFNLFESDGESIWSTSLMERMAMMEDKSQQGKDAALKRWGKDKPPESIAAAQLSVDVSDRNAEVMQRKEMKTKETKGNKIKNKDTIADETKVGEIGMKTNSSGVSTTGTVAPPMMEMDPISIKQKPEGLRPFFENDEFFITGEQAAEWMARFGATRAELVTALTRALDNPAYAYAYGTKTERLEQYLGVLPFGNWHPDAGVI